MAQGKLTFVGVGPQKTATTWLYEQLINHPGICFPKSVKETFFWDQRYNKGLVWYFSHFEPKRGDLLGEIAPSYFHSRLALERLSIHTPTLKILVTLRDPAKRAFSMYLHHRMRGRCKEGFWEAAQRFPEILLASHYAQHLPNWLNRFGSEYVLILLQEDIFERPARVIANVCAFLGIENIGFKYLNRKVNIASLPRNVLLAKLATELSQWLRSKRLYSVINAAKRFGLKKMIYGGTGHLPVLDVGTLVQLQEMFFNDVCYVERLTGRNLAHWKGIKMSNGCN